MKNIKTSIAIPIIFIWLFLVLGITLIVKTVNYESYTELKFIDKTTKTLQKTVSEKGLNEIIDEGGAKFNKLLTKLDIAQNSFALAIDSDKKIKIYNKTKAEVSESLDISIFPHLKDNKELIDLVTKHQSGHFEFISNTSKEKLYC